ncbi:MAG: hypothetical protein O2887_03955 [Bacteroidetes bacterium]|nr:hypothetical protein [Bacteroidota bacterium]MDA1119640.1 hypothetical protein [Bacteroidota bacterium]
MDIENIFYVVLAVIYILSKVMKARKKPMLPDTVDEAESASERPKVTFEDLLKEFGNPEQPQKTEKIPEARQATEIINYDKIRPDNESREIFQKSIDEAAKYSGNNEEQEGTRLKGFKPYQNDLDEDNEFVEKIQEMLSSGEGGKKAVVLAEILNRKY